MTNSKTSNQITQTLLCVPFGKVASYGQIADLAGLPGRARMVGRVLKQSAASQNLPWHRILRADGSLAFPLGDAQWQQQRDLLADEGVLVIKSRVPMKTYRWQPDLEVLLFQLRY